MPKILLGLLFVGIAFGNPARDKKVRDALKQVGGIGDDQVSELLKEKNNPASYTMGLLYPLVYRQGAPKPLEAPIPNSGIKTLAELHELMTKHPNRELLPRMDLKDWSKGLKKELTPLLQASKFEPPLCATELLSVVSSVGAAEGVFSSTAPKMTKSLWKELIRHTEDLALSYQKALNP